MEMFTRRRSLFDPTSPWKGSRGCANMEVVLTKICSLENGCEQMNYAQQAASNVETSKSCLPDIMEANEALVHSLIKRRSQDSGLELPNLECALSVLEPSEGMSDTQEHHVALEPPASDVADALDGDVGGDSSTSQTNSPAKMTPETPEPEDRRTLTSPADYDKQDVAGEGEDSDEKQHQAIGGVSSKKLSLQKTQQDWCDLERKWDDFAQKQMQRKQIKAGNHLGSGMEHLDQLCRLMERLGELQDGNKRLRHEMHNLKAQLHASQSQQVAMMAQCSCPVPKVDHLQARSTATCRYRSHSETEVHTMEKKNGLKGLYSRSSSLNRAFQKSPGSRLCLSKSRLKFQF
uniref:uncharacterized protein n=1 Tax=Myxine glutinosa TaxID=7769 RepID=UPI00358FD8A7